MTALIPAGDRGEFRVTLAMQARMDERHEGLEELLLTEARARGLSVRWRDDILDGSIVIQWEPEGDVETR